MRKTLVITLLLFARVGLADVQLTNGDFHMRETDLAANDFPLERVYNSMSAYSGLFGKGWSSELETTISPGLGGIVIREFGGGAGHEAHAAPGGAPGDGPWESWVFGHERISRGSEGFARSRDDGRQERFSPSGRLETLQQGRFSLQFGYTAEGHLSEARGNGRTVTFTTDSHGRITSLRDSDGRSVSYEYDPAGRLTHVSGPGKADTRYRYATEAGVAQRLVEANYSDGTSLQLSFYGREKEGRTRSVKDREGITRRYRYETDSKNPLHRTVFVETQPVSGPAGNRSYEYTYVTSPRGERLKILIATDGPKVTEREFDEQARPVRVKDEEGELRFEYDSQGRLSRTVSKAETEELRYDGASERIAEVARALTGKEARRWSFGYDDHGRLNSARGPEGSQLKLLYDSSDRLRAVSDGKRRKIELVYGGGGLTGYKDPKKGLLRPGSAEREELGAWLESLRPLVLPARVSPPF